MAQSPGSAERRARLIREMARQSERSDSRLSDAPSVDSDRASMHTFSGPPHPQLSAFDVLSDI